MPRSHTSPKCSFAGGSYSVRRLRRKHAGIDGISLLSPWLYLLSVGFSHSKLRHSTISVTQRTCSQAFRRRAVGSREKVSSGTTGLATSLPFIPICCFCHSALLQSRSALPGCCLSLPRQWEELTSGQRACCVCSASPGCSLWS